MSKTAASFTPLERLLVYSVILDHLSACPHLLGCGTFKHCATYRRLVVHSIRCCKGATCALAGCSELNVIAHSLVCDGGCDEVEGCKELQRSRKLAKGACEVCDPAELVLELLCSVKAAQRRSQAIRLRGPPQFEAELDVILKPGLKRQFHCVVLEHVSGCKASPCEAFRHCERFKREVAHAKECKSAKCDKASCAEFKAVSEHQRTCSFRLPRGEGCLPSTSALALNLLGKVETAWEDVALLEAEVSAKWQLRSLQEQVERKRRSDSLATLACEELKRSRSRSRSMDVRPAAIPEGPFGWMRARECFLRPIDLPARLRSGSLLAGSPTSGGRKI